MPALPAVMATLALLAVIALAIVYGFVHMHRVRESWRRVAARRGWVGLDEPRGMFGAWGCSMHGITDGVSVVVETVTHRRGKHQSTWTRASAAMQRDLGSRVHVQRASWLRLPFEFGLPRVELGGAIDARLAVSADDARVARELVTSAFLSDWERLARAPKLRIENGTASLEWHGCEANEERIERSIDFVTALARAPREQRRVA